MRRSLTFLAAIGCAMLLAIPATAQYGGGAPPPLELDLENREETPGEVQTVTPCSTIIVTGDNWGESEVLIDREFDGEDCPGTGDPGDVQAEVDTQDSRGEGAATGSRTDGTAGGGSAAAAAAGVDQVTVRDGQTVIPVREDGTFRAVLTVPSSVAQGALNFTVSGVGSDGAPKEQAYTFDVVEAVAFTPDAADDSSRAGVFAAVIALLAAAIIAIGFNWPALAARIRRH